MKRSTCLVVLLLLGAATAAVHTQQAQAPASVQSTSLPSPAAREPAWAFPVQQGALPAESPEPKTIPGSTRTYTPKEIDDLMNPPDWFPESHPPAPSIIQKGRDGVLACGSCHLMSGLGHPESADLTGFQASYLIRQMNDFKSGARHDYARMNGIAKEMTDAEIKEASQWLASLPRRRFVRVVEADSVPVTFVGQGRMRFVDPKANGATEPIGNRIITLPEDQELARLRDPRSGFVAYVPPGSIEKGRTLAETGADGKTSVCATCHGGGLKGQGDSPRIAGLHPIYIARQLYLFKDGSRNGAEAGQMKGSVAQLTDEDILNISAYIGSLSPE